MKYAFFITLSLFLLLINPIFAADDRQPKTISGKVRNTDMSNAKQIPVQLTCKNTTIPAITNNSGNYSVLFAEFTCEQFDTITVTASLEEHYGSSSKEVTFALTQNMPDIILIEEVPVSVPEFGTLSAIMAGSVSLLAYNRIKTFVP
ncbi:MAG TPA: hypothetical protein PLS49_00410 [Candidatus Woesebacteria bacterium]|nr:hypothetical protein [Candidatus Woesebacteria bacterium]